MKFKISFCTLCISLFCIFFKVGGNSAYAHNFEKASINFFSEIILIEYDPSMLEIDFDNDFSADGFRNYYNQLNSTKYINIISNCLITRQNLQLNDWFYYRLLQEFTNTILRDKSLAQRTLFLWFLLHKSYFKVQINYNNTEVFLSVYTEDKLYDVPMRGYEQGWFIDLEQDNTNILTSTLSALSDHKCLTLTKGRAFSFKIDKLPLFANPKIEKKDLFFIHNNQDYKVTVHINKSVMWAMYGYPEISIVEHAKIPLSASAETSLIEPLKNYSKTMNEVEGVSFLLSFVRNSKKYANDLYYLTKKNVGAITKPSTNPAPAGSEAVGFQKQENLTFTPEETLYYDYSDCEDRSVLFAYLVRNVLNMEAILLDYPEHAAVAVLLKEPIGQTIEYNGKKYTLCDPTGPGNNLKVGEMPEFVRDKTPSVMTE